MKRKLQAVRGGLFFVLLTVKKAQATIWDDIVNGLASLLKAGFGWVATVLNYIISGFLYTVLSGIFTIITSLINAIDLSTVITTSFANWGLLPTQLVYLINALGIPQGLAMVTYAYIIRLGLNLIPAVFTRV